MLKFLTGTAVGFVAGAMFLTKGLMEAYKRDGDLRRVEAVIARNDTNKVNIELTDELKPLTVNQIRSRMDRRHY